jgi:thiamine transport system substrate-binding protein
MTGGRDGAGPRAPGPAGGRRVRLWALALAGVVALAVAAGCGGSDEATPSEVVLVTHDSFAISAAVKDAFERESGLTLRVLQGGDANEAVNRALLTAGDPQGDVLFGVDDNLLSRALDGELFDEYASPGIRAVAEGFEPPDERVTPIDHGEVCLNVDRGWFAARDVPPPTSLDDLVDPRYRGLLVVENAATSSPGLAFLLSTIDRYGAPGWEDYWRRLRANDVLVVDGWEEAYTQQFSGAAGSPGKRPIVVSYATSPAAEVIFAGRPLDESPTAAVEDGCFRQVEYAGVLRGARNPEGARTLIDFMLSERFQADVPGSMFVYPVRADVPLPAEFERHAIVPAAPASFPPDVIAANRDGWIDRWTEIVLR